MNGNIEDYKDPIKVLEAFGIILTLVFSIWILEGYISHQKNIEGYKNMLRLECQKNIPELRDVDLENISVDKYTYNAITRKSYNIVCREIGITEGQVIDVIKGLE